MDIVICTPAAIAKSAQPGADAIVVMDVLRATSTAVVLGERAEKTLLVPRPENLSMLPGSPSEYLVFSELTGAGFERVDNSPSRAEIVDLAGRTPVLVTTNGTIATARACEQCDTVLLASFLNLSATAVALRARSPERVLLVPAGKISNDTRAFEDDQCAEALAALLRGESPDLSNMANACRDAPKVVQRLLHEKGLLADVDYALRPDAFRSTLWVEREAAECFRIDPRRVEV